MPYKHPDLVVARPAAPVPESDQELILRTVPQAGRLFFSFLAVITAIWCLRVFTGLEASSAMLLGGLGLMAVTAVFSVQYLPALKAQLLHPGFDRWEAWAGLSALPFLLVIDYGIMVWAAEYGGMQTASEMFAGFDKSTLFLLVVILPGVTEEVAFRGLLQHWLRVRVRPLRAIIIASALFAALHLSIFSAPYLFVLGLLLGWVKYRTGSLYPVIAMHVLHNAAVILWF